LYKEEALTITDLIEKTLKPKKLSPSQWPIQRSLILPEGSNFIYTQSLKDPANVNHCIEYTLYLGNPRDVVLRAKQFILAQMLDEPTFNQLRTIEQLGYVVFSGSTAGVTYAGFRILVQSERDCGYLEGRINHFLTRFETTLKDMSDEEFDKNKTAVISKRLETLKNLGQEGNRFWNHMFRNTYDFLQGEIPSPLTFLNHTILTNNHSRHRRRGSRQDHQSRHDRLLRPPHLPLVPAPRKTLRPPRRPGQT
jgi:insulysin